MSETRSHISEGNILHIAVVCKRRAPFVITKWRIAALILIAIPVLVGLVNIIFRIADLYNPENASAAQFIVPQDNAGQSGISSTSDQQLVTSDQFMPTHITIPSIGVSASVESVGLNAQGAMQAPSSFTNVGWYSAGSEPGAPGSAVFDGHVNNALTQSGVFEHLGELQKGDQINVSDNSGHTLTFTVQSVITYPVDQAPTQEIFSRNGPPSLMLITCDGVWSDAQHQFSNRLVVYASLATSH